MCGYGGYPLYYATAVWEVALYLDTARTEVRCVVLEGMDTVAAPALVPSCVRLGMASVTAWHRGCSAIPDLGPIASLTANVLGKRPAVPSVTSPAADISRSCRRMKEQRIPICVSRFKTDEGEQDDANGPPQLVPRDPQDIRSVTFTPSVASLERE